MRGIDFIPFEAINEFYYHRMLELGMDLCFF